MNWRDLAVEIGQRDDFDPLSLGDVRHRALPARERPCDERRLVAALFEARREVRDVQAGPPLFSLAMTRRTRTGSEGAKALGGQAQPVLEPHVWLPAEQSRGHRRMEPTTTAEDDERAESTVVFLF